MGVVARLTGQIPIVGVMGIRNDLFCQLGKLIITAVATYASLCGDLFLGRGFLVALIAGDTEALVFVGEEGF